VSESPKKTSRVVLATEQDLLRDFPDGVVLGPVVRPKPKPVKDEDEQDDIADDGDEQTLSA
jgi:hypothetical protein